MRELPDHLAAYRVLECERMPVSGPHLVFWQERRGLLPVRVGERRYVFDAESPGCTVVHRGGRPVEVPTSMLRPIGGSR